MDKITVIKTQHEFEQQLSNVVNDRYLLIDMETYCSTTPKNILVLSGLRRTGKTTLMMRQALNLLKSGRRVKYLIASRGTSCNELLINVRQSLEEKCEFLFIDEITFVEGFVDNADWIYNNTILKGHYCIVAGTDSYGLELASRDTLFDRVQKLRTTHMLFKEFKHVCGGTLRDYVIHGGIFNDLDIKQYLSTSIVDNIADSIDRYDNANIRGLDLLSKEEIRTAVIKIISRIAYEHTIGLLRRQYKYPDLNTATSNLVQNSGEFVLLNEMDIIERVAKSFGLREDLSRFKDKELASIVKIMNDDLVELDVVKRYKHVDLRRRRKGEETFLVTQPAARFQLTEIYLEAISALGDETAQLLCEAVSANIQGQLMEAVILHETDLELNGFVSSDTKKPFDVFKFNAERAEFDVVVFNKRNKTLFLYEVKRNKHQDDLLCHNFFDEALSRILDYVKRVYELDSVFKVHRGFLYGGESRLDNGVKYINIEEYLLNISQIHK
jgi:hypothetical protein